MKRHVTLLAINPACIDTHHPLPITLYHSLFTTISKDMDKPSIFRLPIFWMFLGPPALRLDTHRAAMASVQGNVDIWNIIRVVWWTVWGAVALYELIRQRAWIAEFMNEMDTLPLWIGLWLGMMFVSTAVSPGMLFTLTTAAMFVMLLLAATDLALKVYRGLIPPKRTLRILLFLSIGLSVLVYCVYLIDPNSSVVVGETFTGITRIRGTGVAYTPLLAQVIFLISLYFWLTSDNKWRPLLLGTMAFGLYFLYIGQTRSAYGSFVIALSLFAWNRLRLRHNYPRLIPLGAAAVAVIAGFTFLYGTSHSVTEKIDSAVNVFVLRDAFAVRNPQHALRSLMTLNGRTKAAAVVLDVAAQHPIGLGYVAGLRAYMANEEVRERLGTDAFHGAHNAYLEVLAGTGFIGFFAYLALIFVVIWRARQLEGLAPLLFRLLFYIVLLQGFFESSLAFAFRQGPVLFWIAAASLLAMHARTRIRSKYRHAGQRNGHRPGPEWQQRKTVSAAP